ncbi:MAG: sugar-binding domain-containing protein [Candidatus Aminicenantales bacterium]
MHLSKTRFVSVMCAAGLIMAVLPACRQQPPQTLTSDIALEEGWLIRPAEEVAADGTAVSAPGLNLAGWNSASVPTTVLAALRAHGEYPDVFVGKNLETIPRERFAGAWWYRTEFDLPEEKETASIRLGFDGINYRADIWLNGQKVASREDVFGSFRTFELDVTSAVKPGRNVLAVEVFPPQPGDFTFGFVDWNPRPPDENMGLWRPVTLRCSGPVSLARPFVTSEVDVETLEEADLTISVDVVNHTAQAVSGNVEAEMENLILSQELILNPGETRTVVFDPRQFPELRMQNPRLWWPHNLGEANLYDLTLRFQTGKLVSDEEKVTFGIREVADYINEEGHRGFMVNGQKVLIRGGGWVDDLFMVEEPRVLEAKVKYTRHMNLNTIRLEGFWGSSPALYNLCDRNGILLMAGWSCQWEWENYLGKPVDEYGGVMTPEDMDLVARSFQDQLILWRNHPSVFVWALGSDKLPRPELERRYMEILEVQDPSRPALMSTKGLRSVISGDTGVKMNGPYDYVPPVYWFEDTKNGGAFGFNTETGPGPQPPPLESLNRMLPADHLWPIDEVWDYHCARGEFNTLDRYLEALNRRYGKVKGLEDFVRKAQVANFEAMRAMFEAFAAHRPVATGVIQWMLNAAWPKLYWQLYDYDLMPNGAFYGAKKASRPVHILYHPKNDGVYVANDRLSPLGGWKAQVRVFDFHFKEVFQEVKDVDLGENTVAQVGWIPQIEGLTPVYFLDLKLVDNAGGLIDENFYWLSTKKDVMNYPATEWFVTPIKEFADLTALDRLPPVTLKILSAFEQAGAEHKVRVTLENPTETIAFFVNLDVVRRRSGDTVVPIYWEDNGVSLLPGESRTLSATFSTADLQGEEPELVVSGWNLKQN